MVPTNDGNAVTDNDAAVADAIAVAGTTASVAVDGAGDDAAAASTDATTATVLHLLILPLLMGLLVMPLILLRQLLMLSNL